MTNYTQHYILRKNDQTKKWVLKLQTWDNRKQKLLDIIKINMWDYKEDAEQYLNDLYDTLLDKIEENEEISKAKTEKITCITINYN